MDPARAGFTAAAWITLQYILKTTSLLPWVNFAT